jgi:hypothetical protein
MNSRPSWILQIRAKSQPCIISTSRESPRTPALQANPSRIFKLMIFWKFNWSCETGVLGFMDLMFLLNKPRIGMRTMKDFFGF